MTRLYSMSKKHVHGSRLGCNQVEGFCIMLQPQTPQQLRAELLNDCRAALQFVIDRNRHFHRAPLPPRKACPPLLYPACSVTRACR